MMATNAVAPARPDVRGHDIKLWRTPAVKVPRPDDEVAAAAPVVLRGYDRVETTVLLSAAAAALASDDAELRRSTARALDEAEITVVLRGFDRVAIDAELRRLSALLTGGERRPT